MAERIIHHYPVPEWDAEAPQSAYLVAAKVPPGTEVIAALNREDKVTLYVSKPDHPAAHEAPRCVSIEAFSILTGESFRDTLGSDPQRFNYVGTVSIEREAGLYVAHVFARIVS